MAAEYFPGTARLAPHNASPAEVALLQRHWAQLGTTEALLETGGDIRLARDAVSGLNGYGASHGPRPWAITFASSTASSSSARGFVAADKARLAATATLLRGGKPALTAAIRRGIARYYGLQGEVVLAASGTDTELLALALAQMATPGQPTLTILIAPEETGRGVPMAARGLNFAVDTARGHAVVFEAPIPGFRPDTALLCVALREPDGTLRDPRQIEAELLSAVQAGHAKSQKIILHALDLSKTGLLAPRFAFLRAVKARFPDLDLVIDACQARLSPTTVRGYLSLDAIVLITGSKFFTGPPFAGALLLPPTIAARLHTGALPAGLNAYFAQADLPHCPAAAALPAEENTGLALRWVAALAEMRAFARVKPARRAEILVSFAATVTRKIAANPALQLLPVPPLARPGAEPWENQQTIFTFLLRGPQGTWLTPAQARAVYLWLNADLSPWIKGAAAARICHIGQPVKIGPAGALRVSAGARLFSGEPAHQHYAPAARLAQEMADLATVFDKIELILQHWDRLWAANPTPHYRPLAGNVMREEVSTSFL
jgi:hypothetical protein